MKTHPKWVHMARYELILRLEGALWLRIILKPLLTPKGVMESSNIRKKVKNLLELAKLRGPMGSTGCYSPWWACLLLEFSRLPRISAKPEL